MRFRIGIRNHEDWGRRWERDYVRELAIQLPRAMLGSDGTLLEVGGTPMGRYELVSRGAHAVPHSRCPYLREVVGFFDFEWWDHYVDLADRRFLLSCMLWAARGYIERTDTGQLHDAIVSREVLLREVVSKHGFDDGGFFIDLGPRYFADTRATILAALDRIGLSASFITYGTSHNPIRIDQFEPRPGQTHASCWELFRRHADTPLMLWGFDVTDTPLLRELLTDP